MILAPNCLKLWWPISKSSCGTSIHFKINVSWFGYGNVSENCTCQKGNLWMIRYKGNAVKLVFTWTVQCLEQRIMRLCAIPTSQRQSNDYSSCGSSAYNPVDKHIHLGMVMFSTIVSTCRWFSSRMSVASALQIHWIYHTVIISWNITIYHIPQVLVSASVVNKRTVTP